MRRGGKPEQIYVERPTRPRTLLLLVLLCATGTAFASPEIALALCGDGTLEAGEQCDDANLLDGDCCSSTCQLELAGSACDVDACNLGGTCDAAGACLGATPLVCDDGAFCNGEEICDALLGCQAGTPPVEDDGVGCTDEICDELADVILHSANDASCSDGLVCNGAEICDPLLDCQPAQAPGPDGLALGGILVADPRDSASLAPAIFRVDPASGAVSTLAMGGLLGDSQDVAVEADRCVITTDRVTRLVIRIDPQSYDPLAPGANQHIVSQAGSMRAPYGVAVAANGDLIVADSGLNGRVLRIDPQTGAQTEVGFGGYLADIRRVALDAQGFVYLPAHNPGTTPRIVKLDPNAYNPSDRFANQEIVASEGWFAPSNGPWDLGFAPDGSLYVVNAQSWNVIRVDVDAYDPLDPFANQEIVGDGGAFTGIRGLAIEDDGHLIVPNESGLAPRAVVRVDPDAYDPLNPPSNQVTLVSGPPLSDPHGASVVQSACGNGAVNIGEQCDDGNTLDGDCCSSACQLEPAGNACNVDACTPGGTCDAAGACLGATPLVCDDGAFCNGEESCDPLLGCQVGTPPVSDDGVACTNEICDEVTDVILHTADDALCDDGLYCTGVESCDPIADCQTGPAPSEDDGVACTDDVCDEPTQTILHVPNHAQCADASFCNGAEVCDPLLDCQPGTPLVIDDGVACTADSCDEVSDVVVHAPDAGVCDDGQFCNGAVTCDPLLDCQPGNAPTDDDGVGCTDEICDELADVIVHSANHAACSDGLVCNGSETCDPLLDCQAAQTPGPGGVLPGEIVVADPRTSDPALDPAILRVDPVSGAVSTLTLAGLLTDPRDVAVEADRCLVTADPVAEAVIRIDPQSHDPLDPGANQHVVSQGGSLRDPRGVAVAADGDLIVADRGTNGRVLRIDPRTGAQTQIGFGGYLGDLRHVALDAQGFVYLAVHNHGVVPKIVKLDPNAFDPLDLFANQEIVASGGWFAPSNGPWDLDFAPDGSLYVVNAQDWNVIRVDVGAYDPLDPFANQEIVGAGGAFTGIRGLATEDDGHLIVTNQTGGQPRAVVRLDPDAYDPLNPASNQAVLTSGPPLADPQGVSVVRSACGNGAVNIGEQCDDGNSLDGDCCSSTCQLELAGSACDVDACTLGGTCDAAGACLGATPLVCDDGTFCNGAESCDALLGCQAGTPPAEDDGVGCTDELCDELADVILHLANDASCDDGLFCTGAETCDPLLDCQPGTPPAIDDGVACTQDGCDEVADVVVHVPDAGLCDDALFCTGVETCDPLLDCQPGTPPAIDDGVACTQDGCDEDIDAILHTANDASCDDGLACTADSCDALEGCHHEPIAGCAPVVPLLPAAARVLLFALLALCARAGLRAGRRADDQRRRQTDFASV